MSEQESPLAEALRVLGEKGVVTRSQIDNILENHGWLVSVGELPELVRGKLHEKLVPGPDTTGSNVAGISARQTPEFVPESDPLSFGVLSGTLTVDRSNEERDTLEDVEALADEHVTEDEPTTVGKKRGKNK